MKIAFLIPSLSNSGGMERVMSHIINYISNNKSDELHLVMFGPGNDRMFFQISKNVSIYRPCFEYTPNHRKLYAIKAMRFIRKTIKSISPDTILSFGEIWNSFVLLSLYGLKYPIYISDRCRPNKSFGKLHDSLRNWLYPKASEVIAQTQKAKDIYLTQFHHNNISVIGNPIRQIQKDLDIQRENIILSVGRLIDTKNFDHLINIFSRIPNDGWKLVIVGGDAIKQHNSIVLQQQVDSLGLQDRVILAGQQEDVETYFNRAKIFAFTSCSEGFPNVIGEALSAGLPVIAYDCIAGPSDMIEDGKNGYLISLFDQDTFIEKLSLLMTNEKQLEIMGGFARRSVHKFNANIIAEMYYKVLSEKVENGKTTTN